MMLRAVRTEVSQHAEASQRQAPPQPEGGWPTDGRAATEDT